MTVAKEIELEDPFENMGAQLLKEAATKTHDIAGDGTTPSTVLAQDRAGVLVQRRWWQRFHDRRRRAAGARRSPR